MKVGYVRVSTREQNTVRQDELMKQLGVEKVYTDKVSGKNTDRPELQKMMEFVREGDTVTVESISRFARNTKDLLDLIEALEGKKVQFVSQKERMDTSTPAGKFVVTLLTVLMEINKTQWKSHNPTGTPCSNGERTESKKREQNHLKMKCARS